MKKKSNNFVTSNATNCVLSSELWGKYLGTIKSLAGLLSDRSGDTGTTDPASTNVTCKPPDITEQGFKKAPCKEQQSPVL